jgi:two-component system chemotaxis sensor kinase CheA
MHFYFFALIAMLAVYGNPLAIVAAAVTVALHHLALWYWLPASVFNYDAPLWVVLIHAAFVVLESVASCFIARSFFDNVIGLEKVVQARTRELDARSRDMKLVLDNVSQGFLTIDRLGMPSAERSRAVDRWFGPPEPGQSFFDYLTRLDPAVGMQSAFAFEQVLEGVLSVDITLAQMPEALVQGESHYRLEYLPIYQGDTLAQFLVVITDMTAERVRARSEAERQEAMHLFERMLADRTGFESFSEEAETLVKAVISDGAKDLTQLKRDLHTLKGNSAVYGLSSIAEACHELETTIAETNEMPRASAFAPLQERWMRVSRQLGRLLGSERKVLELDEAQFTMLEHAVGAVVDRKEIIKLVHELRLESCSRRLAQFQEQAQRVAARLGKTIIVEIEDNSIKLDHRYWMGFWQAFIHAIRNAVDHGIESEQERKQAGKPAGGCIKLRTQIQGASFVIEISDDGRGIAWERVAAKAKTLGLPTATPDQLRQALFADGVSTAENVTDLSGRGVGLGALRHEVEALRGRIEVESELGRGTTLRLIFDAQSTAPELPKLLAARLPSLRPVQDAARSARIPEMTE